MEHCLNACSSKVEQAFMVAAMRGHTDVIGPLLRSGLISAAKVNMLGV